MPRSYYHRAIVKEGITATLTIVTIAMDTVFGVVDHDNSTTVDSTFY